VVHSAERLLLAVSVAAVASCAPWSGPIAPAGSPSAPSASTLPQRVGAAPGGRQVSPARVPAPALALDQFDLQRMYKRLTDLSFITQLSPEMIVRKITYSGADKLPIPAYFFAPKDTSRRRPALLFVHGGIHGDLSDGYVRHIRSLVREGYVIVAPEYRGSTGYGRAFYEAIDYGGKEVEDVIAARTYLRSFAPYVDLSRLGIIGWSHGGFITLHSIFRRPELFKVAVAHVPVTDLPTRIRTHSATYERLFAAQPAYGATLAERPQPYIERSPIAHVRKLRTPLLVHAATNDEDVFIIENHNLRDSMIVAGKDRAGLYYYREWIDPPGGHEFNRLDTPEGKESWDATLAFLRSYLNPRRQ
jgi:dipeptidyl aminopeptidase/acylaminoacyl peptidase